MAEEQKINANKENICVEGANENANADANANENANEEIKKRSNTLAETIIVKLDQIENKVNSIEKMLIDSMETKENIETIDKPVEEKKEWKIVKRKNSSYFTNGTLNILYMKNKKQIHSTEELQKHGINIKEITNG